MTLVPINLRKPEEWTEKAATGNVATGIMVRLPIALRDPLETFREVRARIEAAKADPSANASPMLAEAISVLPRSVVTWLTEGTFGNLDFIVTNVPGVLVPRYLAGAEIVAAYPFAPVALRSPASVALYGYRDSLFIGINSDVATMPDVERFETAVDARVPRAAGGGRSRPPRRRRAGARGPHAPRARQEVAWYARVERAAAVGRVLLLALAASAADGRRLYLRQCAPCHGVERPRRRPRCGALRAAAARSARGLPRQLSDRRPGAPRPQRPAAAPGARPGGAAPAH